MSIATKSADLLKRRVSERTYDHNLQLAISNLAPRNLQLTTSDSQRYNLATILPSKRADASHE